MVQDFDKLNLELNRLGIEGSVLVYDYNNDTYHSNNLKWIEKKFLPASTFKIPHSIIALELGIVKNAKTILKWDGIERWRVEWEKDLSFKDAFRLSCVPCYQRIALEIGAVEMRRYLDELQYFGMILNESFLDTFWLEGSSAISQKEQVNFLKKFYLSELPVSPSTQETMKELLEIEKTRDQTLSGKTGWAITGTQQIGWFVGYVEKNENVYFFATNILSNTTGTGDDFLSARTRLTMEALEVFTTSRSRNVHKKP